MTARWLCLVLAVLWLGQPEVAEAQRASRRGRESGSSRAQRGEASSGKAQRPADDAEAGDELGDLTDLGDSPPAPSPGPSPSRAPAPAPADEPDTAEEDVADEPAEEAAGDPPAPTPEAEPLPAAGPSLRATAFAGGGIGMRQLRRPLMGGGSQGLKPAWFPAVEIGLMVHAWPAETFSLRTLINYQTSLGLVMDEDVIFALKNAVAVRSERAEVSVAPTWKFSDAADAPRVSVPLGVILRNFWPSQHEFNIPRYTLIGPHARLELMFEFGELVKLRFGPEAQLVFLNGEPLRRGGVSSTGFAVGGEAHLELKLGEHFALELNLRQANALVSSVVEPAFLDIERFVTLRLLGVM